MANILKSLTVPAVYEPQTTRWTNLKTTFNKIKKRKTSKYIKNLFFYAKYRFKGAAIFSHLVSTV